MYRKLQCRNKLEAIEKLEVLIMFNISKVIIQRGDALNSSYIFKKFLGFDKFRLA